MEKMYVYADIVYASIIGLNRELFNTQNYTPCDINKYFSR